MKRTYLPAILTLSLAFAGTAAANIIYNVNRTVGAGSVVGFIETDGVIGTVQTADIVDWNLLLNDGTGTATLLGPLSGNNSTASVFAGTDDLIATLTLLQFDFSGSGGFMNFFTPGKCSPAEWSFETTGSGTGCNGTTGNEEGVAAVDAFGTGTYSARSGLVTIGSTAVPEPSTFAATLLVLALSLFIRKARAGNQA